MKSRKIVFMFLALVSFALPGFSAANEGGNNSWFRQCYNQASVYMQPYKNQILGAAVVAGVGYCAVRHCLDSRLLKAVKASVSPKESGLGKNCHGIKFQSYRKIEADHEDGEAWPMYFDVKNHRKKTSAPQHAADDCKAQKKAKCVIDYIKDDLNHDLELDAQYDTETSQLRKHWSNMREEMSNLTVEINKLDQRTGLKHSLEKCRNKSYGVDFYDMFYDDFYKNIDNEAQLKTVKDWLSLGKGRWLRDLQWELMERYLRVRVFFGIVDRDLKNKHRRSGDDDAAYNGDGGGLRRRNVHPKLD